VLLGCTLCAIFAAGVVVGQNKFGQPKSVIHVVTLKWTPESTPAQREKAIEGVKTMASKVKGIKNIWLKTLRVQGPSSEVKFDQAFVIEFENEAAVQAYADDPAHKDWEGVYLPVRAESRSHQITN
jgi:hypothetical protein